MEVADVVGRNLGRGQIRWVGPQVQVVRQPAITSGPIMTSQTITSDPIVISSDDSSSDEEEVESLSSEDSINLLGLKIFICFVQNRNSLKYKCELFLVEKLIL